MKTKWLTNITTAILCIASFLILMYGGGYLMHLTDHRSDAWWCMPTFITSYTMMLFSFVFPLYILIKRTGAL